MTTKGKNPKELKIAYIGGGSKGWAWGLMSDLAQEPQLAGQVFLYDIDHHAAKNNEIIGNKYRELPDCAGDWTYKACGTLSEALAGADFVVISILPGDFNAMASDVHTPESFGIWQSVGDTTGPGGIIRSLRTIPMYEVIGRAIREWAPDAWVINYTNPMTVCVRTLNRVFPGVKAFGCCHEVFGTQKFLCELLETEEGISGVQRHEIRTNVLGINHFTWLTAASWKNRDLFPLYRRAVSKCLDPEYQKQHRQKESHSLFSSGNLVKMDLFDRFGAIAAAGDRHLAEFVPDPYLLSPKNVQDWMFFLTPVSWRIEGKKKSDEQSERLAAGLDPVVITPTGEEGVRQMKALLGLGDIITNVNMPNRGQQSSLPPDAVVETNAVFSFDHVQPLVSGALPSAIAPLVQRHSANQENTVTAGLARDLALAKLTFQNDPLVRVPAADASRLFDTMVGNTRQWLDDYFG